MIMPRGDTLLLPANPLFVWFTLLVAFVLNLVPLGRTPAMPDFLALVLVFWNVHQTRRVGVGVAFLFGLMMDIHDGAVLGQHALAYTLLSFFAITIHRRLLWFTVPSQAVQILPLFLAAHAVSFLVRMLAGGMLPAIMRTTNDTACAAPNSGRICTAWDGTVNQRSRRWMVIAKKLSSV